MEQRGLQLKKSMIGQSCLFTNIRQPWRVEQQGDRSEGRLITILFSLLRISHEVKLKGRVKSERIKILALAYEE